MVAISDIDADVLISYGAIRGDLNKSISLSDDEIKQWLMDKNIGWDFQKQKSSIPRMKKDKLYKLYNACVQHNCLGDISIIDPNSIPDHDLFTYSFPCQDISVAGNQKGLEKGGGTRSGLLWECEKIIAAKKPKYLLMENVKNLVGKKFKADFDKWCSWLEEQGYKNFYKVLNAKDYGVPQNRERVFMVSILDENATYEFPEKFPLELRLKDILEDVVDEKYYIDNEASNRLLKALEEKGFDENKDLQRIGNIYPSNGEIGNIYMSSGLSPTLKSGQGVKGNGIGSNNAPKVVESGYLPYETNTNKKHQSNTVYNVDGINPTLAATDYKNPTKIVCEQRCDEGLRFFKGDVRGTIRTIEACGDKRVIECGTIRVRYEDDGSITQKLEINGEESSNTITTVQKDNMIVETAVLRAERTEYGKEIRKAYESGEFDEKIGNMREYRPRPDGITNTITTVQKDNMLLEKTDELVLYDNLSGGKWDKIHESSRRVYDEKGVAPTVPTCQGGNIEPKTFTNYRIRKLTPKECWRLMGMKDEHFDRCVDAGISNSGLYKQAGNSIVVDVLEYIFKELFTEYIEGNN